MEAVRESRAYQYCEWCLRPKNKKVGKYIKMQAKAWKKIADGKDREAYVDEAVMRKVESLLRLIVHPDLKCSMYEGLEDYAMLLIIAIMCTGVKGEESFLRYYETAVLEIARKNFKTFTSAVIFIILMLTEPDFSRFFSVAPDLSLSRELQVALKKIIKASPALYSEDEKLFRLMAKQVNCEVTDSEYIPLAYSKDRMDGKLAHAFLADEAGALDTYPVEAMRSSQITLKNPLGIIISTQYPNDNNAFEDEVDLAKKRLAGLLKSRIFALLYEPDDEYKTGDAWMEGTNVIYQANPAAVNPQNKKMLQTLLEKREIAILYENKRENFLCKHLNIKYKGLGTEGYIEITRVQLCRRKEDRNFWRGKTVFLGVDLSQTEDNTAVSMVCVHEGKLYGKSWGFIPAGRVEIKQQREQVDYKKLIRDKVCFSCGDEVIDYGFVEDFVMGLEDDLGVHIAQIGYDRYNAISSVQKWEAAGYECVEIKQHSSVLHEPTKMLKEEILKKNFSYDENLMLEINFQNARCTEDTNLNKYVNKKKSEGKVDMVVALINAVYLAQQELLYGYSSFVVQG